MTRAPRRIAMTTTIPLLLVGGWLLGLTPTDQAGDASANVLQERALRLIHDNACRRVEAELAKGERFYLVLDPDQGSLSLKLRGTVLRNVSLDSIEIGRPRRVFVERDTPDDVRARLHRRGRLVPRRPLMRLAVEVPENPDEQGQTIMLPPEPETAIVVPRRFLIRYEGGVALELLTEHGGVDLRRRMADGFAALFGRPELRLRLGLDRAAAEAFFRAVPDDTDLLVL